MVTVADQNLAVALILTIQLNELLNELLEWIVLHYKGVNVFLLSHNIDE